MASDRVQISRLQFAGTPTSRFAICRSRREMATGNVPALFAYLDPLMRDAHEYQRSVRANGEIAFRRTVKGKFADARSHCILAVRTASVEVRGCRDILRRLRFWRSRNSPD